MKYNKSDSDSDSVFIDRLVNEWVSHKEIIIACDFDDTISPFKMLDVDYLKRIQVIKEAQLVGATLIIWTSTTRDRYPYILDYCKNNGLNVHSINTNKSGLKYGNEGKIYANIYLDDRAGLTQSLKMLELATSIIKHKQINNK